MNGNKNYYLILGAYPNANINIIEASYHRLKIHLHGNTQTSSNPNLNEAYQVMSDEEKRFNYNQLQGKTLYLVENYIDSNYDVDPEKLNAMDNEWITAIKKFPDLIELDNNLRAISWCLSHLFKSYLLENKDYLSKIKFAKQLENEFLMN